VNGSVLTLFGGWDAPARVAALVAARAALDVGLVAVVAVTRGIDATATAVEAGLTALSVLLTVAVLGSAVSGQTGLGLSRVEFLLQVCLLAVAGVVVYRQGTTTLQVACVALAVGIVVTSAVVVPLYGEATVAP